MGKGQSKHGQCYLVNAHFNPLCQLEETNSLQNIETPLTSQDSGLQLTPEISFTLSEEDKSNSDKNIPEKCALQVFLPKESVHTVLKDSTRAMDLKIENCSGETSIKNHQKVTLECVQNNNQSEKQELSFVLRNYTGAETDKNDVEKIVLSSICEALKSSLKLPASGTHTLKVHLTLSPVQEQTAPHFEQSSAENISPCEGTECTKLPPVASVNLCQHSAGNLILPETKSASEKKLNGFPKCCQHESIKNVAHSPMRNSKHEASPSPRSRRQKMFSERKDARKWVDAAQVGRRDFASPNFKNSPRHSIAREKQHQNHVEHHPNAGDCSHYLDIARLKISEAKNGTHRSDRCDPRCLNPAYCSPRQLNRAHKLCHFQKFNNGEFSSPSTPKKHDVDLRHKLQESELHSGVLKYKLLQKAKNNLLDFNFDLCDLEDKHSVEPEAQHQHRRSRSHDTNQYSFVNSPKVMHHTCSCTKCTLLQHCDDVVPQSPNHHHRHCHRKREKDKLRAMEQVARWLEREDMNCLKQQQKNSQNSESCSQDSVVERHEYHHIHEHHHYYHYVES